MIRKLLGLAFLGCAVATPVFAVSCGDDSGTGGEGGSTAPGGVGGGAVQPPAPSCAPAPTGGTDVSAPELVAELSDDWHEAWLASPAVADLDGDGTMEIVTARSGRIIAYHFDNTIVWSVDVDGRCWSSPVVADLRPDLPGLEVAEASAGNIYMFTAGGAPVPGFPYAWSDELRSLAAGDVDGDGQLELVSVTTNNVDGDIVIAVNPDGTTVSGFPPNASGASGCDDACYIYNGYDQNVAIGDVDGDGRSDIFATQDNAYNSLHDGTGRAFDCAPVFQGKTKFMGVRGLHDFAEAEQGYAEDEATALQAHHTNTAPAIADIDGDGVGELVYVASVQNASQEDRLKGVALWALENDGTRPAGWETPLHFPDYLSGLWDYGDNIVAITNQVSVVELDPSRPGPEMIFAGFDGRIHAVDSQQNILWEVSYTDSDVVGTGGVAVADLSGDGTPEIVFTTYSTQENYSDLFVLDGGGNLLHRVPLPGRGAMPVPTIADADGDGALDIVVALKDSESGPQLQIYRVASASNNCLLWPTGRGNDLRDGYLPVE
ncbi:MAG: VCBS repeat-containing protein [Polyangiaceae bacterium]